MKHYKPWSSLRMAWGKMYEKEGGPVFGNGILWLGEYAQYQRISVEISRRRLSDLLRFQEHEPA